MPPAGFAGHLKSGASLLTGPEKRLTAILVPLVPWSVQTYHLTLLTVLWSALNVVIAFKARTDLRWLWMVSFMILCQYATDLLDGAVGRARDTGLVKWGFYMDHFLDYIFLCSLAFVGYSIAPAGLGFWFIGLLGLAGAFMVNSFLSFSVTNRFEIYFCGIGPTETRIALILINTFIVLAGTGHFHYLLPASFLAGLAGLTAVVWKTQRLFWKLDMEAKTAERSTPA
jgi:archaetidylinositol phosphate synthase